MAVPDIVGKYAQGFDYGQAKAEQARRRPILDQLDQLKLRQSEQAIKQGEQKTTLQGMLIKDNKRKQESEQMKDFGQGAAWAMNQPDPNAAWDQVLTQYESEGKPVDQFRGRTDLMPMIRDLNNPDYAKQQAVQNNIKNLIQTMPASMQPQAQALGQASPQALYKAAGEGMFKGDTTGQLATLTKGLNENEKVAVEAAFSVDPKIGANLVSKLAMQKEKPQSSTDKKAVLTAKQGLIDLDGALETFESLINDPNFEGAVGPIDQYTASAGAAMETKEGLLNKKALRASKKLVQDAASALSGSISDADLLLLEQSAPSVGDSAGVWRDWYETEYKPLIERSKRKAQISIGVEPTGIGSGSSINDLVNKYAD